MKLYAGCWAESGGCWLRAVAGCAGGSVACGEGEKGMVWSRRGGSALLRRARGVTVQRAQRKRERDGNLLVEGE